MHFEGIRSVLHRRANCTLNSS